MTAHLPPGPGHPNASHSRNICNPIPHPPSKVVWGLDFNKDCFKGYLVHMRNFCNLDTCAFPSSQRRSTWRLQLLSRGRCYSLTLFSTEVIISSQQGLVWLSRSHCTVAAHCLERLSCITGVYGVSIQSFALSLMA